MKKSIKLIFCEKNDAQIRGFFSKEKSSKSLKKMFFEKNNPPDTIFKTVSRNLFEINGS